MLKGLGCLLLLGCAGMVHMGRSLAVRREITLLNGLFAALSRMEEEIRLCRMPLPRLLRRLGGESPPPLSGFFLDISRELSGGGDFGVAWGRGVPTLALPEEAREALGQLRLTGDEESVLAELGRAKATLERVLTARRAKRAEGEKLSAALCFSSAAFLILILI